MNANPAATKITAEFVLERETKSALRYQEVDDKSQPVEMVWAKIGTLYIRKTAFQRRVEPPNRLTVTVEAPGGDRLSIGVQT
jgi:hypothetical protein